jgi:hypothetical protein
MREMLKDLGIKDSDLTALLKKQNQKLGIEDPEEEELPTIEVKLEQHQGQIYAFHKGTNEFLGQGTSREDLIDHISKRMKNVKLTISQDDGADLLQKNNT